MPLISKSCLYWFLVPVVPPHGKLLRLIIAPSKGDPILPYVNASVPSFSLVASQWHFVFSVISLPGDQWAPSACRWRGHILDILRNLDEMKRSSRGYVEEIGMLWKICYRSKFNTVEHEFTFFVQIVYIWSAEYISVVEYLEKKIFSLSIINERWKWYSRTCPGARICYKR